MNLKQVKDLNVRPETTELLGENMGRALFHIHHRRYFPGSAWGKGNKCKNKWDLIKSFHTVENHQQNPLNGRKHLQTAEPAQG